MKLRYYLRGLGIGIIVTAVVMGASANGKKVPMTNEEILAKAKELEAASEVLSEIGEAEEKEPEKQSAEEEKKDSEKQPAETKTETKTEEKAKEPEKQPAEEKKKEPEKQPAKETGKVETVKTYTIAIYPGEGSYTVSKKLATQGLVESADIYDQFLCQNGYDKRLCTGNYTIRAGTSADEIAKILTAGKR